MVKVIGAVPCSGTKIERDPWIPLKVSWLPASQRQPLYLRVSGSTGGELECKIDPASGSLMQLIVILPPKSITEISQVHLSGSKDDLWAPVIDCSILGEPENLSGRKTLEGVIIRVSSSMKMKKASNGMRVDVGESNPVSFVRAGDAEIGYAADGQLASLTVLLNA